MWSETEMYSETLGPFKCKTKLSDKREGKMHTYGMIKAYL